MLLLFPGREADIRVIFKPYIDEIKDFVTDTVEENVELIFKEAHEKFKTKSGDIEPMQELRLDRIKQDLVDLVTTQVKQNM